MQNRENASPQPDPDEARVRKFLLPGGEVVVLRLKPDLPLIFLHLDGHRRVPPLGNRRQANDR